MYEPTRIDLKLPRSWNACTTEELESIARIIAVRSMEADRYHPYNAHETSIEVFFALAKIEPVEPVNPRVPVEEQYVTCRFARPKWTRPFRLFRYYQHGRNKPFTLYLWQIDSFIEKNLKWLESGSGLTIFPYQRKTRRQHGWKMFFRKKRFAGPNALMDGMTWRQYRIAQDYMSFFIDQQNNLIRLMQHPSRYTKHEIKDCARKVDLARSMFLATIFNAHVRTMGEKTQKFRSVYDYQSNQHSDNAVYFRHWTDVQWQVVLFWWSGMMAYMQKRFPHCFKATSAKKITQTPLDLYTRTTATMQKYTTLNEEDVNHQTVHIILQHLEDMAKENEEMEKIRRKR